MTATVDREGPGQVTQEEGAAGALAAGADCLERALDDVVASLGGSRRPGQHEMARAVWEAFSDEHVLLVEAGTGTGKSLAYLVPAVLRAARGERVVVSTATLALQRQLLAKDVPQVLDVLADRLGRPVRAALLKGWHNYVCRHKLAGGYPSEADIDGAGTLPLDLTGGGGSEHPARDGTERLGEQVVRLRAWAQESTTGDRDELVPGVSDRAWRTASVTKLDCLGARCPLLAECFPERARAAAHSADIVLTNHAILGVAAAGAPGVLPEHDAVVVDEAHELATRVRSSATAELSGAAVARAAQLTRRHAGILTTDLEDVASRLAQVLLAMTPGRVREGADGELADLLTLLAAAAREALAQSRPGEGAPDAGLVLARSALTVLVEIADRLLSDSVAQRRDVLWCSEARDGSRRLNIAPLEVDDLVGERLLADRAAVLTSATLRVGGEFAATAVQLGLREYTGLQVPGPFDYRAQAIRYVAAHLPAPGPTPSEEMLAELVALVEAASGATLGLFSSRRAAEVAAAHVREVTGREVLCQGEDSLPNLVARFRDDDGASLFGTLSLWQGVDVPGATCRLVVIDRIPFPRPDDPVVQARSEVAARRGANEFMAVSATHAALLLAQGVGRLVRSTTDRGVVAVLDSRLAKARYAPFLLRSLPPMWPSTDGETVRSALRRLAAEAARRDAQTPVDTSADVSIDAR